MKCELCCALVGFKIGECIVQNAEELTIRHADDELGDFALYVARDSLTDAQQQMSQDGYLEEAARVLVTIEPSCGHVLGAFKKWSQMRTDEQWSVLEKVVDSMVNCVWHSAAAVVKHSSEQMTMALCDADAAFVQLNNAEVLTGREAMDEQVRTSVHDCGQKLRKTMHVVLPIVKSCTKACSAVLHMISKIASGRHLLKASCAHLLDEVPQKIKQAQRVACDWVALLAGEVELIYLLVDTVPNTFGDLAATWKAFGESQIVQGNSLDFDRLVKVGQKQSYVVRVLKFMQLQSFVAAAVKIEWDFDWYIVELPSQEEMHSTLTHIIDSPIVSMFVDNIVLKSVFNTMVSNFLEKTQLSTLRASDVGALAGAPLDSMLAVFVAGGLKQLAGEGKTKVPCNLNLANSAQLPHAQEAQVLANVEKVILARFHAGVVMSALQETDRDVESTAVPENLMENLFAMYASICTCLYTAAVLNDIVFNSGGDGVFLLPDMLPTIAKGAHPTESGQTGFRGSLIQRVFSLLAAVKAAEGWVTACASTGLENASLHLKYSLPTCRQWLTCARRYGESMVHDLLSQAKISMQKQTESLEAKIPRWETAFSSGEINQEVSKTRLLGNKYRHHIKPLMKYLSGLQDGVAKLLGSELCKDIAEDGFKAELKYTSDTQKLGEEYLLVVASLNTILFSRAPDVTASMASSVLDIASKKHDFKLPECVQSKLQELTSRSATASNATVEVPATKKHVEPSPRKPVDVVEASQAKRNNKAAVPSLSPSVKTYLAVKTEVQENSALTASSSSSSSKQSAGSVCASPIKQQPESPAAPRKKRRRAT